MKYWRPTVTEERWLALAARYPQLAAAIGRSGRAGDWRSVRTITRMAYFVLGLIAAVAWFAAVAAVAGSGSASSLAGAAVFAGLTLFAVAEWLIVAGRAHSMGIEEALELAGAALFLGGVTELIGLRDGLWLLAAAGLLAVGWRLRNALFTCAAALAFCQSFEFDPAYAATVWWHVPTIGAAIVSFMLAVAALAAGVREFARPCYDRMLDWCVVILPVASYLWLTPSRFTALSEWASSRNSSVFGATDSLALLAPLVFGGLALWCGMRRRTRAPLIAAALCAFCAALELGRVVGMPWHWQLIALGLTIVATAVALIRWLRVECAGISSQPVAEDLLASIARAAIDDRASVNQPVAEPTVAAGGGSFGGGGASGRY